MGGQVSHAKFQPSIANGSVGITRKLSGGWHPSPRPARVNPINGGVGGRISPRVVLLLSSENHLSERHIETFPRHSWGTLHLNFESLACSEAYPRPILRRHPLFVRLRVLITPCRADQWDLAFQIGSDASMMSVTQPCCNIMTFQHRRGNRSRKTGSNTKPKPSLCTVHCRPPFLA